MRSVKCFNETHEKQILFSRKKFDVSNTDF